MQFLMSLNESYAGIRGQILMIDPLPPVSKVFNLVVQDERQRSIGSTSPSPTDSLAFSTSSSPHLPSTSMTAAVPFSPGKPKRECPICSHCGITRHTVDRCYKLHGCPPGYKPKPKGSQAQVQQNSLQSTPQAAVDFSKCQQISHSAATTMVPPSGSLSTDQVQQLIAYRSS